VNLVQLATEMPRPRRRVRRCAGGRSTLHFHSRSLREEWSDGGAGGVPAPLTLYLLNATASGSNHGSLQVGGSAPSVSTMGTGWSFTSAIANEYSLMVFGSTPGDASFGASAQPSGAPGTTDCWRTQGTLSGSFAAGTWSFAISLKADLPTRTGNPRVRVWYTSSATGASATEITAGAVAFTAAAWSNSVHNFTVTASLGAAMLASQYLFLQCAWNETTASPGTPTINFQQDGTNSVVTTPNFTSS